jgi:hypothetical protein
MRRSLARRIEQANFFYMGIGGVPDGGNCTLRFATKDHGIQRVRDTLQQIYRTAYNETGRFRKVFGYPLNQRVLGSSPSASTILFSALAKSCFPAN